MARARAPIVFAIFVCACAGSSPRGSARGTSGVPEVASNILRSDYAGSAACARCHADIHRRWSRSPMHWMTRLSTEAGAIRAPFDGREFRFKQDRVTMTEQNGARFMTVVSRGAGDAAQTRRYRITKRIGGRYREDFVGALVDAEDRAAGAERIMPVSYVLAPGEWRYKGYSVMLPERPYLDEGAVWKETCIVCHNTMPYLSTVLDDLYGDGAPKYQGSLHDRLLAPERRLRFTVTDSSALSHVLEDELSRFHVSAPDDDELRPMLATTIQITQRRFEANDLVEIGVGCEACHGGSREHVQDPTGALPSYRPRSAFLSVHASSDARAHWINRACARCHTVLFSEYAYTWEGGARRAALPGGSQINSGEARDFLLGACSDAMSCTTCHDPHAEDTPDALRRFDSAEGNAICVECHASLRAPDALRAHAHHDPSGPAGACASCHMPRKNMGLGYRLTRYHRIGSPTDRDRVERDRPLECALCHADRSIESLVSTMERWWNKRYSRNALAALYGEDLRANVLARTLARGKPHEQAVAVAVLGDARDARAIDMVVEQLSNDIPLVRYFARESLTRITGTRPDLDMSADGRTLVRDARQWLTFQAHAGGRVTRQTRTSLPNTNVR